jgi:hypothetical protein
VARLGRLKFPSVQARSRFGDVDGTRLVMWTSSWETTTTTELGEAYDILDSVRFE